MNVILTADIWILQAISHLRCGFLDTVMPIVTALGDYGAVWIAFGLLLLFRPQYRRKGLILLLTLLMGALIGQAVIKPLVGRIRPFAELGIADLLILPPTDFSFPSGHTAASVSAAIMFMYVHRKWGIAACVLAAMITFSRMYLWMHYPSDILAGALLGAVLSFAAIWADKYFQKRRIN